MNSTNQLIKPLTTKINKTGNLEIGGCDLVKLAEEYGTPLYVIDEYTIRQICKDYKNAFKNYEKVNMMYASKALCSMATSAVIASEGFGFDVLSTIEPFVKYFDSVSYLNESSVDSDDASKSGVIVLSPKALRNS